MTPKQWWNSEGRHAVRLEYNRRYKVTARSGGPAPGIIIRDSEPVLPSAILQGLPWVDLNETERRWVSHCFETHIKKIVQPTVVL